MYIYIDCNIYIYMYTVIHIDIYIIYILYTVIYIYIILCYVMLYCIILYYIWPCSIGQSSFPTSPHGHGYPGFFVLDCESGGWWRPMTPTPGDFMRNGQPLGTPNGETQSMGKHPEVSLPSSNQTYNVRPPSDVSWFRFAPVTIVIRTKNHSYWSYKPT